MLALAFHGLALLPLVLGSAILVGCLLALVLRSSAHGMGARFAAVALYLCGFIAVIGYIYPRFLLPLLIVAVPFSARGWASLFARPALFAPGIVLLGVLVLSGGPVLDLVQLTDTRYVVERWLARVPDGTTVEIFGNPHFQARVPRRLPVVYVRPSEILTRPHGPSGDVVLVSVFDRYWIEREPLRTIYGDSLFAGPYRSALEVTPPRWSALISGLSVSPWDEVFVRRDRPVSRRALAESIGTH